MPGLGGRVASETRTMEDTIRCYIEESFLIEFGEQINADTDLFETQIIDSFETTKAWLCHDAPQPGLPRCGALWPRMARKGRPAGAEPSSRLRCAYLTCGWPSPSLLPSSASW